MLLLNAVTAPGSGIANHVDQCARTFQAVGATTAGSGSATIGIEVSNDATNWLTHDTITLTLSTTSATAGIEMDAPWAYVRGNVTAISGTGAAVSLFMGV